MTTTSRLLFGLCVLSLSGGLAATEIMPVTGTVGNNAIVLAQGLDAQVESANVKPEQVAQAASEAEAAPESAPAEQAAQAEAEEKARLEAEARVARLKAKEDVKAEAARIKAEKKAKAEADAQVAAEAKAEKLRVQKEAKAEAARLKAEQKAQAQAEAQAATEAKQAAKAEATKAQAAQVAPEAEAAPAPVEQAAESDAEEKARLEAEARIARLKSKDGAKAEAARIKAEKKAKAEADAKAAAEAKAEKLRVQKEAKAEAARLKAEQKAQAQAEVEAKQAAEAGSTKVKTEQAAQATAEAEAARVQAEQTAKVQAEARQAAEAEAAKVRAEQAAASAAQAEAARVKAEQAAQAEAAKLKAEQDAQAAAEAARLKEEERTSLTVLRKIMSTQGVQLALDPTDANVIFHKDPGDNSSFPVLLIDGDQKLSGRIKTKGSFTRNFIKKSLVITFDGNTTWHGQHKVSFNAMATDVSQTRDYLANDLMKRLKMATPDMQFTKLYVNGGYVGEYMFVEWIEPKMFDRFGLGSDGELYSPDDAMYCGSFDPADMHRLEKCYFKLDKGQHDYSRLKKLAQDLNDIPADKFDEFYDKNFDNDSVINWLVVNTLTGNEDTYNKNFFLYFSNKTQKWTVVPWDYDLAFGRVGDPAAPYPFNRYNKSFQYLHPPESGASSPLKEKTLKNSKLYKRYLAKIRELFSDESMQAGEYRGWYHPKNFGQVMAEREKDNSESIKTEKYPNPDREDYSYVVDSVRFFNEWRYQYLSKLMLTPTVWDTPLWKPYSSFDPLTPRTDEYYTKRHIVPVNLHASIDVGKTGKRVFFIDPLLATPLMAMDVRDVNKSTKVLVEVESQQPPADVPRGIHVGQCVERTWHINVRTPGSELETGLEMDFLDEGLTRHELGAGIKHKKGLALWMQVAGEWRPLDSEINPRSNSFVVKNVVLNAGIHTLVACESGLHEAALKNKAKAAEDQIKRAEAEAAKVKSGQAAQAAPEAASSASTEQAAQAEAEEKARREAEAKASRLKAKEDAKAEAARIKAEKKAKAEADAQAAAEAKAAKLKAQQEAKAEAARLKAEQKAQAQAEAQAAAEAKQAAPAVVPVPAEQAAQAGAEEKARLEAEAKIARLKAKEDAKAEAARIKAEKKAKAEADAKAAAEAKAEKIRVQKEAKAEAARLKAEQKAQAQAEAKAAAEAKQAAKAEAAKTEAVAPATAEAASVPAEQAAQAETEAEEKARLEAEAKVARLKAKLEAKANAGKKVKASADITEAAPAKTEQVAP